MYSEKQAESFIPPERRTLSRTSEYRTTKVLDFSAVCRRLWRIRERTTSNGPQEPSLRLWRPWPPDRDPTRGSPRDDQPTGLPPFAPEKQLSRSPLRDVFALHVFLPPLKYRKRSFTIILDITDVNRFPTELMNSVAYAISRVMMSAAQCRAARSLSIGANRNSQKGRM